MPPRHNKKQEKKQEIGGVIVQPSLALHVVNRYLRWILLLIAAIAVWVSYTFIISAQISQVRDVARNSLAQKERTLSVLTAIKQDLTKIVLDFNNIMEQKKEQLGKLEDLLPRRSRYEELFTQVDALVAQSGMKLSNITIAFEGEGASQLTRGSFEPKTGLGVSQGGIKELQLHISVEGGTYETLKTFLTNFERSVRLFDLSSVSFDGAAFIPNAAGELPTPHYDLELTAYYQS